MNSAHILVVDDEAGVRELIKDVLSLENFEVTQATDGLEALNILRKKSFDLLVLDVTMPKMDGLALLEKIISEHNTTPVLLLSARNDKSDVTSGLKLGADDYVTKPFGIEELVLRIRAILRRTLGEVRDTSLRCGPISMDCDAHLVKFESTTIELSPTEYSLLEYLLENKSRVVTKEKILEAVWGYDFENNSTVVETYISYLRKKLHINGYEGIRTIRGVGFQIIEPS